jgi:hypothetical protein
MVLNYLTKFLVTVKLSRAKFSTRHKHVWARGSVHNVGTRWTAVSFTLWPGY